MEKQANVSEMWVLGVSTELLYQYVAELTPAALLGRDL